MRVLMFFTMGFSAACALCVYILPQSLLISISITAAVFALISLILSRSIKKANRITVICLGLLAGLMWFRIYQSEYMAVAQRRDGIERDAVITVSDYSYQTDYGYSADGFFYMDGRTYRLQIYFEDEVELEPGDRLYATFRFRYTSPKEGERTSHFQGKGIFLKANQRGSMRVVKREATAYWHYPAILGKEIKEILQDSFPEDVYGFVKALLLGDSSSLDYSVDTDLRISGIRHIIAVSGLHVSILYGLIHRLTGRRRFLTALIGFPALVLFAAVAGFTPSVTRACAMVGLMMLADIVSKEYDSPTALAFACFVMLVMNPMTIGSVSFQLSVGSVAGILLFQTPMYAWLSDKFTKGSKLKNAIINWFAGSISVSISAMTFTTALSAIYFGAVSIVGILTNLLTLWVVSFVFCAIVAVCVTYIISVKAAVCIAWIVAWPVRYVLFTARILSRLPLAAVYTSSVYIVAWLAFCYILLAFWLLLKKRYATVLISCISLSLCFALGCSWAEPLADDTRLTMLDVGQGQCILFQSDGKTYLVDCGGPSGTYVADTVMQKLYSQGIRKLDGIILTHCDADHANGLEYLLERVDTPVIFLPATEAGFRFPETEARIVWVDRKTELSYEGTVITLYPPVFTPDSNENSICVLFDTENCDILITGDRSGMGERILLKNYDVPPVDLLIAGHHGSKNSTSAELLSAVLPETVFISVGKDNYYGHPSRELLNRLREFDCAVYRTDLHGTIIYRR